MATIKLGTTKSCSKLINYAEKRAEVKNGLNCPAEYSKSQMNATRELWGKTDGIQAHHVIQSFKPNETNQDQANEIGQRLAEKIAPGHEVTVYTHTDTHHIHNHIVINSVNFENGSKYQLHGKDAIENVRNMSDELCLEHDLSVVTEHNAGIRYTLAEKQLLDKGKTSWKDEIREHIESSKEKSNDFDSFKKHLEAEYGVKTKLRGTTLSFKHSSKERYVRANKLGADYELEGLQHGFERQIGRKSEYERTLKRNEGTQQIDDELHSSSNERRNSKGFDDREPIGTNSNEQQRDNAEHDLDYAKAERIAREKQRSLASGFDEWTQGDTREQRFDGTENEPSGKEQSNEIKRDRNGDKQRDQNDAAELGSSGRRSKKREQDLTL